MEANAAANFEDFAIENTQKTTTYGLSFTLHHLVLTQQNMQEEAAEVPAGIG